MNSEVKYQPSTNNMCLKCPSPLWNTIQVVASQLIAVGFLSFIIIINIRKKSENQFSILLRIFTNYTQLLSAILSSNVKLPWSFEVFSSESSRISSADRTFFSFDCFVEDYEIKVFAPSNALFKLSLYLILPLFLMVVFIFGILVLRGAMYVISPERKYDIKRFITITFICVILLFHPSITLQSLSVFQCVIIDSGDSRMLMHMDYK